MNILLLLIVGWLGFLAGYILHAWLIAKYRERSGTIVVTKTEEKTLFTLELDIDPESIEKQKEVIFRVEASESLNRT